ncbi:MAG: EamA family transporter [Hyphomicrobiaceae bacterium]
MLAAALLHASWNAMAKGNGGDPLIGATVIAAGAAVVSAAMLAVADLPAAASHPYVVASGIIHVGYFLLLGLSYRLADYSAVYPLMRGSAPLLTTGAGALLLGEHLALPVLVGIVLLSLGVLGLGLHALMRGGLDRRGIVVAGGNVAIIVAYTVIDGVGTRLSGTPAGYVAAMMLLTGVLLVPAIALWRPRELGLALRQRWPMGLAGGAMVMASYGAALWAMTRAPIGAVAALRETSVLFGALIAVTVMKERLYPLRVVAALVIFAGLACMRLT